MGVSSADRPLGQSHESAVEHRVGRSISLDQAAELLGVSRRTIYNRIRDGRLHTIRTFGGSQRVVLDSVLDMMRRKGERRTYPRQISLADRPHTSADEKLSIGRPGEFASPSACVSKAKKGNVSA
jgi:excisionase family DNA binding protein